MNSNIEGEQLDADADMQKENNEICQHSNPIGTASQGNQEENQVNAAQQEGAITIQHDQVVNQGDVYQNNKGMMQQIGKGKGQDKHVMQEGDKTRDTIQSYDTGENRDNIHNNEISSEERDIGQLKEKGQHNETDGVDHQRDYVKIAVVTDSRAFLSSILPSKPDVILFLGDYFDGGPFLFDEEWQESWSLFKHIFDLEMLEQTTNIKLYYLAGNHDIGYAAFHSHMPEIIKRYEKAFGARNYQFTAGKVDFIAIDAQTVDVA
ncbi:hypothetical protein K7X08_013601 [Anisodus acutangulus]|uniref:Calcineurin-like phosphoesterase domain-containing protein n=1 Tax=Anisodus acutangulus TaxID=402998 RepID=A0A9Q1R3Z3_9SOLA|nr:hypothetical protein K7X08_013601 [Anisodus acutangulus]